MASHSSPCRSETATGSALSAEVAALVQAFDLNPRTSPLESSLPPLVVFFDDDVDASTSGSQDGNRDGDGGPLLPPPRPRLCLESGPLCPASLLGLRAGANGDYDEEGAILAALDARSGIATDRVMLRAARALREAAGRAALDVAEVHRRTKSDARPAWASALSPRTGAALRLIAGRGDRDDDVNRCAHLCAAQLLLSEIEATLEYLYLSGASREPSRASHPRLRNVLTDRAVRKAIGLHMCLVLHVLLGPLNGVCVRNLVWHGYLGPDDVERSQWAYLLFLIAAFGLPDKAIAEPGRSRPTLLIAPPNFRTRSPDCETALRQSLMDHLPSSDAINALIDLSPVFVPRSMRPALSAALIMCRRWGEEGQSGKGDDSDDGTLPWCALSLLYVVLERGLRALFARANPCLDPSPELARTDSLQVTMATMLRSVIAASSAEREEEMVDDGSSNGTGPLAKATFSNCLLPFLGAGPTAALYDDFVWIGLPDAYGAAYYESVQMQTICDGESEREEPLPCRNELVHGSLPIGAVPVAVLLRIIRLSVGLAAHSAPAQAKEALLDSKVRGSLLWIKNFESRRHPTCHLWRKFSAVCRNGTGRQLIILDDLLPLACSRRMSRKRSLEELNEDVRPSHAVLVDYCTACSLPTEYCVYSPDPSKCLECRFGPALPESLPAVARMTIHLVDRLRSILPSDDIAADELALSDKICAAVNRLAAAPWLGNRTSDNLWEFFHSPPPRRSSAEAELTKLWAVREAVENCGEIARSIRRRALDLVARSARGEHRVKIGSRKQPLLAVAHRLAVTLQGTELVLVILLQQFLARDDHSMALSTFLSVATNTMIKHIEKNNLRLCVGIVAGLLGGGFGECPTCNRLIQELPRANRYKFSFNFECYTSCALNGQQVEAENLMKNRFVLGQGSEKKSYNKEGCDPGNCGAAWESLRRWQLMSE